MSGAAKLIQRRIRYGTTLSRKWYALYAAGRLKVWSKLVAPTINSCWKVRSSVSKTYVCHREMYELIKGKIPEGCELHHVCFNKWCVNPKHLKPLTKSEHMKEHARLRKLDQSDIHLDQ